MADTPASSSARRSEAERIVQLVVGAILTLVIGWGATTLSDTSRAVATLSVEVKGLRDQIDDLKVNGRSVYLAADAAREFGRVDSRLVDLEQRVRTLEAQRAGGPR